jgi:hypothetical protein
MKLIQGHYHNKNLPTLKFPRDKVFTLEWLQCKRIQNYSEAAVTQNAAQRQSHDNFLVTVGDAS